MPLLNLLAVCERAMPTCNADMQCEHAMSNTDLAAAVNAVTEQSKQIWSHQSADVIMHGLQGVPTAQAAAQNMPSCLTLHE